MNLEPVKKEFYGTKCFSKELNAGLGKLDLIDHNSLSLFAVPRPKPYKAGLFLHPKMGMLSESRFFFISFITHGPVSEEPRTRAQQFGTVTQRTAIMAEG